MAPRPVLVPIPGLDSEPMSTVNSISARTSVLEASNAIIPPLTPLEEQKFFRRATSNNTSTTPPNFTPGEGSQPASAFNNQAILALFAILGAAMVVAALWFFFWAKNGGFHFQEGDWDDYKSTVLRRKGPDGRTLSNATKSTKLGGSTIAGTQQFKWARQQARSVVSYDEKGRKGILAARGWGKTHSVYYSDNFTEYMGTKSTSDGRTEAGRREVYDMPEPEHRPQGYRDRDVQEYKREKPARVGGINRVPDGSHVGTNATATELSDLYSDSDRASKRDEDRERAERRARAEAAKMERRWKKEAEEAAAALARESAANTVTPPRKSAAPAAKPSASHQRHRSASRSASPKKRDFSYTAGTESDQFSTSASGTQSTSKRTSSSYYEEYQQARQAAAENVRHSARQSSPVKKSAPRGGGYRRGADSDLD